jgi:cytosine/adenosine deaminase-related metal-dependent hydrolase
MTSQDGMRACFAAVTDTPARILGLEGYGIAPAAVPTWWCSGRRPHRSPAARATRLLVLRAGRVIARTPPAIATLDLPGRIRWIFASPDGIERGLRSRRAVDSSYFPLFQADQTQTHACGWHPLAVSPGG